MRRDPTESPPAKENPAEARPARALWRWAQPSEHADELTVAGFPNCQKKTERLPFSDNVPVWVITMGG